eukprot:gnl/Spiro4/13035_TR6913_c0_g1_i1.p1 gnl/Spiro4/13035_TR6913_c0_g1~~gnl/Spiro4/13035_TR6913_c0_g1_i1.p1  ORF type:complete len:327 (-),score=86.45 gnl/Spiro4/13035_TR6913_c0_g1_i1:62-1012(-)
MASPPAQILVIDSRTSQGYADWAEIFKNARLRNGRVVEVVQCGWDEIRLSAQGSVAGPGKRILVHVRNRRGAAVSPEFCLIRNEVYTPDADHRNLLYGLMFAGVPSVNSLHSIYHFLERPLIMGELHRISRQLGAENFPVVSQNYFAGHTEMMYGLAFPAVIKVGAAHAGVGKARIRDHHDFEDIRSLMAMTSGKYCTVEPFLDGEFDLRIQKIGDSYRVFKRMSMSGDWKTNTGTSVLEELPMNATYRRWAEAAGQMFGGLDICTVDALHDQRTGREVILEVNGTSSGLSPDRAEEDNRLICQLVLDRMNALLCN